MRDNRALSVDWIGLMTHIRATVEEDFLKAKILADVLLRLCDKDPRRLMEFLDTEDVVLTAPKGSKLIKDGLNYRLVPADFWEED